MCQQPWAIMLASLCNSIKTSAYGNWHVSHVSLILGKHERKFQAVLIHLLCFGIGKCRQGMPQLSLLTSEERGTLESKIQSDGQYSPSLVQINRKLRKLKEALLISSFNSSSEVLQHEEWGLSLKHFQYMELFPDKLISEVYSKAKLNRPFERLIYDEMEDSLVSVLFAINGEYEWRHSVPCQIPFGDFCDKHRDLRSFTAFPRSYKLEEQKSQVIDKKYFHLLEGGGLFSCGLPSVFDNVREPQGTLYMDGNAFVMRSVKRESKMDIELTACFGDGLIACFFLMGNGSISLQLSNPNGSTVEMDSHGFIYMCSTYMDFQSQMTCQQSETMDYKQSDSQNNKNTFGDPTAHFLRKTVEQDCWRCILPSGTVLCDQQNGELVAMFRNGNVSEYTVAKSQCCQWTTTNSQGYQVVQVPQEEIGNQLQSSQHQPSIDQSETSSKIEVKVQEDKRVSSKTPKDTKQTKKDDPGEVISSKSISVKKNKVIAEVGGGKGTNVRPQETETKTLSDSEEDKNVNSFRHDLPKIVSDDPLKPSLFLLPRKRVVGIMDLQTNCRIFSREDLVTVVQTPEGELIAQHSDGTQMYTRPSKSQSSFVNTNPSWKKNCNSSIAQENGFTTVQGSSVVQENRVETANYLSNDSSSTDPLITRKSLPNDSTFLRDLKTSSAHVDWQIMKENYPTVWSEGDNIMVDISTQHNQYSVSFCKSTGTLHLLLPGGQCMYTNGLSVFLDCSNMRKHIPKSDNPVEEVKDLEAWEISHMSSKIPDQNLEQQQQQQGIQANGLYKFNLEEGVISHEDPSGDGFYAPQGVDVQRLCVDRGKEFLAAKSDAAISEMMEKSKPSNLQIRGPIPRFFVLHEDGHGYELFGSDVFDNELEKIQKEEHSLHISEEYKSSPDKVFLHTFIWRLGTNFRDIQPSLPCSRKGALESTCATWPSKKTCIEGKLKHCAHMKRPSPICYSLPQVLLQTPSCKPVNKHNEFFVSYRHIREYTTMDDTQSMEMDEYLAKLTEWINDSLTSRSTSSTEAGDKLQQVDDATVVKSEFLQT